MPDVESIERSGTPVTGPDAVHRPPERLRAFLRAAFAVLTFLFCAGSLVHLYGIFTEREAKAVAGLLNLALISCAAFWSYRALRLNARSAVTPAVLLLLTGFIGSTLYRLFYVTGRLGSVELWNFLFFSVPALLVWYCARLEARRGAGAPITSTVRLLTLKPGVDALDGIGGWLWLVVLGLLISLFTCTIFVVESLAPIFTTGAWLELTQPGGSSYDPVWAPLILFELGGNILLILLPIAALVFMWEKSKYTPRLVIAWLVFTVVFTATDLWLTSQWAAHVIETVNAEDMRGLTRALVNAAIWGTYFERSKRVQATFTQDWPKRRSNGAPLADHCRTDPFNR